MVEREDILRLISQKGPIVPTDITGVLKVESFLIGAMLSELVHNKKLKISHAKLGGSPLYYLDTQKSGLSRLYNHLNEKDRRAYDILQRDVILLDEPQTPLMRTALRNLKDFAVPFKVTYKGKQLLYWRWHLAAEEDVKKKVHSSLSQLFPQEKKVKPPVDTKPVQTNPVDKEEVSTNEPLKEDVQVEPKEEVLLKPVERKSDPVKKEPISEPKPTPKEQISTQKTLSENSSAKAVETNSEPIDDEFALQVSGFLNSMDIRIIETTVIKKKKEIDFTLTIPSPVGDVKYFAKARNKKKSTEGDISTAYVEGQLRGLPVLYVSPGEIPKKLESILSEKYKNLKVLKV